MATESIKKVSNDSAETSTGGYCKLPDGTLMQWGSATINSGGYTTNVALPVPFVNKNKIAVTVATASVDNNKFFGVNYTSVTESQLSFGRTPNTSTDTIYWFAIGRWK